MDVEVEVKVAQTWSGKGADFEHMLLLHLLSHIWGSQQQEI